MDRISKSTSVSLRLPSCFLSNSQTFRSLLAKKKKKISRSFRLSFRPLSSYFTYFRFLLIYTHTRTHMDRGNIYRGNQLSLLHIDSANVCQRLNTRAIRGFPLAHESSTFNSESVGLFFFFFHRWNPAQRPCRGWKNQGYFPVDWFLSMRNRVIRLGTFGSCVSFLSFMHAYIGSAWNFQVSFPPPFFFVVGDVGTPGEDTKRNLEETYSKRRSFVKTFLFLFFPPLVFSFSFYTRLCFLDFWLFEKQVEVFE